MPEPRSKIIRPVRSGQITIPAEFRQELGITADTVLQISLMQGELRIRPLSVAPRAAGSPWLQELYDLFAPVREETSQYSEAEIDAAIDEALNGVRRSHA
jgi:bifunctional DNA-binding transcriptional regulator/antitoxin component of YhaV-PrlF toxin-antitoxin module